jgi:hypothetical protein
MDHAGDRSAISTLLLRWVNPQNLFTTLAPTNHEVLAFAEQNYDRLTRAVEISRKLRKIGMVASLAGAVYFKAEERDLWFAQQFFTKVQTGENLHAGHPALVLRNTIINNKGTDANRRLKRLAELFYIVRAWNAARRDETLQKLQLPPGGIDGLRPEHFTVK